MTRVVNYSERYSPPAPFEFLISNENLKVNQGEDFILNVKTHGKIIPEQVMIVLGNESYYLENIGTDEFQYRFAKPMRNTDFYIQANQVSSGNYTLKVVEHF